MIALSPCQARFVPSGLLRTPFMVSCRAGATCGAKHLSAAVRGPVVTEGGREIPRRKLLGMTEGLVRVEESVSVMQSGRREMPRLRCHASLRERNDKADGLLTSPERHQGKSKVRWHCHSEERSDEASLRRSTWACRQVPERPFAMLRVT
jgi:hypothetical protein